MVHSSVRRARNSGGRFAACPWLATTRYCANGFSSECADTPTTTSITAVLSSVASANNHHAFVVRSLNNSARTKRLIGSLPFRPRARGTHVLQVGLLCAEPVQ